MFAEYLYRSPDLLRWEYLHPFIDADPYAFVGDDGACPYFYPIGNGDGTSSFISATKAEANT